RILRRKVARKRFGQIKGHFTPPVASCSRDGAADLASQGDPVVMTATGGKRTVDWRQKCQLRKKFSHSAPPLKLFHDIGIFAAITAKARLFFVGAWGLEVRSIRGRCAWPTHLKTQSTTIASASSTKSP